MKWVELFNDEIKSFFVKIIIPAFVAVSIKIAINAKTKKVTFAQVIGSFVIGIGSAYIFGDYVMESFTHEWQPMVIAVIAISGDKIGSYFMDRVNVEKIVELILRKK